MPWIIALVLSLGAAAAPLPTPGGVAFRPVPGPVIGQMGEARPSGLGHAGTDFAGKRGQVIHAAFDGVVVDIRDEGLAGGIVVELLHPGGYRTRYCHMFDPGMGWQVGLENLPWPDGLRVGAVVRAGDPIGYVGNSGQSRTWHLHFSYVPPNGLNLNPETIRWTAVPEVEVFPYWFDAARLALWEANREQ